MFLGRPEIETPLSDEEFAQSLVDTNAAVYGPQHPETQQARAYLAHTRGDHRACLPSSPCITGKAARWI